MLQSIFPAPRIHGVTIGQKRFTAKFLDHIGNRPGIIRAKIADIAEFTKMELDGNDLALHI